MRPDWAERLRAAARLGVGPEAFWRLSLAEWRVLAEPGSAGALGRSGLEALLRAHPDGDGDDGQL